MTANPLVAERFVRRTQLGKDEYRKNFRQLDGEIIAAVTSAEADAVTPLMSKIYLRLANAPEGHWELEGVLRFAGTEVDGQWATAWERLVTLSGVSSATARKALQWMHKQGIVGYFAGKNGVGIRIFLNRASSSIGRRPTLVQKNLRLVSASTEGSRASANDTPFRDSFADSEILDTDSNSPAPKDGAETKQVGKPSSASNRRSTPVMSVPCDREGREQTAALPTAGAGSIDEVVERLKSELEHCVKEGAARAALLSVSREMERTRQWFETKALPKAVRVAQHETYELLRKHVGVEGRPGRAGVG